MRKVSCRETSPSRSKKYKVAVNGGRRGERLRLMGEGEGGLCSRDFFLAELDPVDLSTLRSFTTLLYQPIPYSSITYQNVCSR